MQTATLKLPAVSRREGVKKLLIMGIIFLTSEKFFTLAAVIGSITSWFGMLVDSDNLLATGTLIFLLGFAPWSLRLTARDLRQQRK